MFASSNYPPDQAAAERFVSEMRHGTLIACSPDGHPQVSMLPFVKTGDIIELHCVQGDPTFDAVQANPRVTFFVSDFLAWSPHDWVNEQDAGRATLHFRAVAFECDVERVSTDPNDVAGALSRLVAAYEPGASYEPAQMGEFYGSSYIVNPLGKIEAQASYDKDELLVHEIDLDMIRQVRDTWQFFRDRRPDAYGSLVQN